MANNRFVNNTLSELQEVNRSPIFGCEALPLLTLEEAVEKITPLFSRLMDFVATAKRMCNRKSTLLTQDESAAIYLYSMATPFVSHLNDTLRAENRHALKPWFAFLKLFITALEKLPSTRKTVWRGVFGDVGSIFADGDLHIWWSVNSCSMDLKVVERYLTEPSTLFAIDTVDAKDIAGFSTFPEEQEIVLMPGTRLRAKCQSLNIQSRLFLVHLEEENPQSKPEPESNYLFDQIRQEYQRNSRLQRIMNPAKSFPIEQSYINLAIVTAKDQHDKEKQLRETQSNNAIMSSFEEIYGMKTAIEVKDIFQSCKDSKKQVLVFGRAGIGKSTFCRYIAYQWARGSYWSQYELLALIPLRRLTTNRYPPDKTYTLIDLVKKEVFPYDLTEKEGTLWKNQFDAKKTLWILDGYDEIVQNVPPHLECLLEQLLKTPHHILTSRPYLNTLSYDVQTEITGFTDKNIEEYVQQFFNQMKDELDNATIKSQTLLKFLKSNRSIWGVAHIPVNLELICSLWSNEDWSQTEQLTMTTLYNMMTEWLCRRYLRAQDNQAIHLSEDEINQRCQNELAFLQSLAFQAMTNNTIVIRPTLLKKALNEAKVSSKEQLAILNIGVLKSFNHQGTGIGTEMKKDHYFVHLSFQEFFAARYLINALQGSWPEQAIEFIRHQKYNQRYALLFTFASGLLTENDATPRINLFWDTILGEPSDLVGIRHMQLVISCLEETSNQSAVPVRTELLGWIAKCIKHSFFNESQNHLPHLLQSLRKARSVASHQTIMDVLIDLLRYDDIMRKVEVLSFISQLEITNPSTTLITSIAASLNDQNEIVREHVCQTLGKMGEKAVTHEVISKLVSALEDESKDVRRNAWQALGKMGEKAATNEVISKLGSALGDESEGVRWSALIALENMGGNAATTEVISNLASALGDKSEVVRRSASEVLATMGEKAATNEVISKLVSVLGDESDRVRRSACNALGKMGEKASINEVISKLESALGDENENVRSSACRALTDMGEKAATNEVISKLVSALGDESDNVRRSACKALGKMGEKASINEVISKLVSALGDENENVRRSAGEGLGKMREKAATNEVISKLVSALGDESDNVRRSAGELLGKMGEKAATNEVIVELVTALGNQSENARSSACEVLRMIGDKAAPNEVISMLGSALGDESKDVRGSACEVLAKMGEKAATNEVISKLVSVLGDESEGVRRSACKALGKMGKKAATNEVISKLGSALGDESEGVRWSALIALENMGDNAATTEVISNLASALGDKSEVVRRSASEVLAKMGEKAATTEVISKLVSALGDESDNVRRSAGELLRTIGKKVATNEVISMLGSALGDESKDVRGSACEVLAKMGEKAATNEVISKLVSVLGDESEGVRWSACRALVMMGEKAATTEVINKLVSALRDERVHVRQGACEALGRMGKKAAINEVISKLGSALRDKSENVRWSACRALVMMGEKAATTEVITNLANALGDKSEVVRRSAGELLGKMGEKAATNEVINKLLSALGDESENVRESACEALGMIGEKAATTEVISKLLSALGDESEGVRRGACEALGKIGEKAATTEVISKLLSALGDESEDVRSSACEVLAKMGEKAATNEVISKLVSVLGDESEGVRRSACKALGKMGKKAATNEVISKLVSALGDVSEYVRKSACRVLENMGVHAVTNEVMKSWIVLFNNKDYRVSENAVDTVKNILSSVTILTQFDPKLMLDLCLSKYGSQCFGNISSDQLISFFLTTKKTDWLRLVTQFTLLEGVAVIVGKDEVVIYGREERLELSIPSSYIRQQLVQAFTDQAKRLYLAFETSSEA